MAQSRKTFVLSLLLFVSYTGTKAHHNTGAVFDLENTITIVGVVSRFEYRNPHIYFFVRTDAGTEWRVEAGPTALMNRLGWSDQTLSEGDRIQMTGNPSRRANKLSAFLLSASVDGRTLPVLRSEETYKRLTDDNGEQGYVANSFAGTWVTLLSDETLWVDYPDSLPLTSAGRSSIDNFDENTMSPALDCTPMTAPSMMLIPDTKKIEVLDLVVYISSEFNGATRTIHLGERPSDATTTVQGVSIGTLSGDVLRVETVDFDPHRMGIAYGLASGSSKRLVEEFRLSEDGKGLDYSFTLTDSEYLERPFEGQSHWSYRPEQSFVALPCDLENSRRFLDE